LQNKIIYDIINIAGLSRLGGLTMPIYKTKGKKDGLQKYNVRVNYISDSGDSKQLTRVAYGLEAAKELERRLNDEIKNKDEKPEIKMTVQQLYDEFMIAKRYEVRETTVDKYRQTFMYYILPTFKDVLIDQLTPRMLQEWKFVLEQKGLSLNTKKHAFGDFRSVFNYAIKMEYYHLKNPISKIGNFKDNMTINEEMNIYTADDFKKFINAAKLIAEDRQSKNRHLSEWDFYVFFNIAFYTGLRKGEIFALKWSDIKDTYLSVKRSIAQRLKGGDRETPPKNKSSIRTLQMPLPLIQVLKEHKERQAQLKNFKEDDRICGGKKIVRSTTVQRRNELYAGAAGLKLIRIHDFRHSHVSVLANENINIQEIARRLGHSRIEMTWNTYSHLYPREEERAVNVLNGIA